MTSDNETMPWITKIETILVPAGEYVINGEKRVVAHDFMMDTRADRQAPQIPEGYALVPIKPTEAMLEAMEEMYMPFGEMAAAYDAIFFNLPTPPKTGNEHE